MTTPMPIATNSQAVPGISHAPASVRKNAAMKSSPMTPKISSSWAMR